MQKKQPRNKFEARIERELKKAKVEFKYESERIPYVIAGHYIPDFILSTPTGKVYIETKGYLRPEAKRKMVAVKRLNPHIDLRILFYAHKTQYIKWATKNGFRWAVESIPQEWMDGL